MDHLVSGLFPGRTGWVIDQAAPFDVADLLLLCCCQTGHCKVQPASTASML
jgi:hypothetical protein